ncbi:EF-hand calcium-binding domain-containing protein 6-like isoform X1 [Montipora capricornis]|uniref:EF-hand calcium-binding domain-containing protein 6-like isoform X1 n=1 Tax=Montipora capricornis TaxID=246305 RepID=UPI0035F1C250
MSLIAPPRQEFPNKLLALPVIEHPGLRLPSAAENNARLQIRGNSREGSTVQAHDSLPPLRRRTETKAPKHSRVLTWPIGQGKAISGNSTGLWETPSYKLTPEELEGFIREKLPARITGLRQAFRSNDPMGKGNISREALATILYHLCGYLTTEQINGLLKRLGLDAQGTIAFENFVTHFQDGEILTKEWIDPVVRPTTQSEVLANFPANKLRQRQRELALQQKHAQLKRGRKTTPPKFYSALEVFPQLKRRAQLGTLSYKNILPPSCLDVDGIVLKPQVRTALQVLGYQMYEEEFEKVWDRFDKTGHGAVDSSVFFKTLGVNPFREHLHRKEKQPPPPTIAGNEKGEVEEETISVSKEAEECEGKEKASAPTRVDEDSDKEKEKDKKENGELESVMNLFSQKFKEGYNAVLNSCRKYDPGNTGQITRVDFRRALSEHHLQLGPEEVERFLQRCGMQEQSMVPYKKVMDLFLDRSEKGRLQSILADPKHRFNSSRDSAIGSTSAVDAEARLLDIMQSDFLALLGAFKQLDRDNLGVVKRYQFKDLLETRFNIKITDEEIKLLVRPLLADSTHALVPYAQFLELFSSSSRASSSNGKVLSPRGSSCRPTTSPKEVTSPRRPASRKELERSATELEIRKKETPPRSAHALFSVLRELLTEKFQAIFKAFQGMDQLKKGFISKGMFQRLLERYDIDFTSPEIDLLFSKLPSEANGFVSFEELVQYSFLNFNVTSHGNEGAPSGALSQVLQEYAKSVMHRKLEPVPEEREADVEGLPTSPSQIQQEELTGPPTGDKTRPPSVTKPSKPAAEVILKRIKPQVCAKWSELRDAFTEKDVDGSATLDFDDFKRVLGRFCKDVTDDERQSLCWKFDRRKNSRVWYLEFLKYFLPTLPMKAQEPVRMTVPSTLTQVAYSNRKRAQETMDAVVRKIRNQMISDWKGLRRTFKKLDVLGDGFVSVSDFKAAMIKSNFSLHEEDFFHIFSVLDENMAGRISYVEFMTRCLSE